MREDELRDLVQRSPWMIRALSIVRDSGLPDAWIGAGAIRDLVWSERYGHGFDPASVRDVDVVFLDAADRSRDNDDRATQRLVAAWPNPPWEAKNQAAVHTWYPTKFGGGPVAPLRTIADAVATWPEYATAVAYASTRTTRSRCVRRTVSTTCSTGYGGATRTGSARRSPGSDSPATAPPNAGPAPVS